MRRSRKHLLRRIMEFIESGGGRRAPNVWNSLCKAPGMDVGVGESRCLQEKMLTEKGNSLSSSSPSRFHLPKET